MPDPLSDHDRIPALLVQVGDAVTRYFAKLDDLPVRGPESEAAAGRFNGRLPEEGDGSAAALTRLLSEGVEAATRSAGPRFFHFVTGGSTPAALAADWFASALDNNAGLWVSSPLGSRLEQLALEWLKDLLQLPASWGGVLTTGATMANFTALAAARQWWGQQQDVNIAEQGMSGLPALPVLTSGFVHASVRKALGMLGVGHALVQVFSRDPSGRVDLENLERALREHRGAPAIVVATAGEVNAGLFDPIEQLASLAYRHHAWLHVDGAFGLFARVSPMTAELARGVELADSAIADGHKWLNVPYDCGFAFVRDGQLLHQVFGLDAPYFPAAVVDHPDYGYLGPEMSRRARALAVWATLAAYGRGGYRSLIERHVRLARMLGDQVRAAPDFELLEEPQLNVVCFRYRPDGVPEKSLDDLNRRLGQAVIDDGRVYFGTTVYAGKVAFRPAIANWRTTQTDVDLVLPVTRALGARLVSPARAS